MPGRMGYPAGWDARCDSRDAPPALTCSPGAMLAADPALVPAPVLRSGNGGQVYPKLGGRLLPGAGMKGKVCFKSPTCVGFGIFTSACSRVRL